MLLEKLKFITQGIQTVSRKASFCTLCKVGMFLQYLLFYTKHSGFASPKGDVTNHAGHWKPPFTLRSWLATLLRFQQKPSICFKKNSPLYQFLSPSLAQAVGRACSSSRPSSAQWTGAVRCSRSLHRIWWNQQPT